VTPRHRSGDAAHAGQGDLSSRPWASRRKRKPGPPARRRGQRGTASRARPRRTETPSPSTCWAAEEWTLVDGAGTSSRVPRRVAAEGRWPRNPRRAGRPCFMWMKSSVAPHESHTSFRRPQKIYRSKRGASTERARPAERLLKDQLIAEGPLPHRRGSFEALGNSGIKEKGPPRTTPPAEKAENSPGPGSSRPNVGPCDARPGRGDLQARQVPNGRHVQPSRLRAGARPPTRTGSSSARTWRTRRAACSRWTKRLSTDFPGQGLSTRPLAESTILGVACGLASYGWRAGVRAAVHRLSSTREWNQAS